MRINRASPSMAGMMRSIAAPLMVAAIVTFSTVAQAQDTAPDELVRNTVSEVLAAIKKTTDRSALMELAETTVLKHFDFGAMTRLATGRAWAQASASQRQALEQEFRTMLVRTYTTALSQIRGEYTVDVKPAPLRPDDSDTIVRTLVRESGRKPISMDYRMAKTRDSWKVYDVVVENLSLVTNYRGSFASEINRSGIDGLIKVLEARNRKAEG
jgi:phospholipid transport system substrate-binding protein